MGLGFRVLISLKMEMTRGLSSNHGDGLRYPDLVSLINVAIASALEGTQSPPNPLAFWHVPSQNRLTIVLRS